MAVPFADITDALSLSASDFECIEGPNLTYSGDSEVIRKGDGTFLQEDSRMTTISGSHKYWIINSAATLPVRGQDAGGYFIDEVATDKPENGHWSMTVTFHKYEDVSDGTHERSDSGLS